MDNYSGNLHAFMNKRTLSLKQFRSAFGSTTSKHNYQGNNQSVNH